MGKRKVAFYKDLGREVPYNKLLEKDSRFEIREVEDGVPAPKVAPKPAPKVDPVVEVKAEDLSEVDQVASAIRELDADDPAHFTKSGAPSATVLTELVGFQVKKDLRDAAWANVLAE